MLLFRTLPSLVPWAKNRPPGARLQAPGLAPGDVNVLVLISVIRGIETALNLTHHLGPVAADNIASRIIQVLKPLHHSMVAVQNNKQQ